MYDNYLFFDIEVFYRDAFVVFKDIDDNTLRVFHNDFEGLEDFVTGKTLVGYNNQWYDDIVLHSMMECKTPAQIKALNDRIIGGEEIRVKNYKFESLDCFSQIDPSMPGLKKIEGNMGKMILESSISFDIERELTKEEYEESLKYCSYDVTMTIEVFKMREEGYFKPKKELVERLGKPNAMRWNTTTISANLLLSKPLPKWSDIRVPDEIMELVPFEVQELWRTKDKGSITIREFDNDIVFGFGGIHGANVKKTYFEDVYNLDVESEYTNIQINHNILGPATGTVQGLLDERVAIKKTHQSRQLGLKLVLNSISGLLKSQYSLLFNPKASVTMCAIGQCIIYELAKRLSHSAEIVQLNTDGVAFIPHNDDYKRVWKEWQEEFNFKLEEDIFTKFWQKDVNNYIAVTPSGALKTKGGEVGRYTENVEKGQHSFFKNNNARIVDIAIVDKLVYGKDILDTLMENADNPVLFQYILKAGGTYQGTYDQEDKKHEKINRVFAARKGDFCLYKKRHDGGMVKFADAPSKMFLWNDDCEKLQDFDRIVDLNHYYQLITHKLGRWN